MSRLRYRHRSITSRQLDTLCTVRYIIKNLGVSQPGSVQADKQNTEGKEELRGCAVQHASLGSAFRWSYSLCSSICQFGYVE
jgi:hypothetical protein